MTGDGAGSPEPVRIVSVYVPHGRKPDHWHFEYKLAFFDALADDFNTVSLPGRMKTPSGFTEPFTVHLRDA